MGITHYIQADYFNLATCSPYHLANSGGMGGYQLIGCPYSGTSGSPIPSGFECWTLGNPLYEYLPNLKFAFSFIAW